MILPKKQLKLSESYFGYGAYLLQKLACPTFIENLWDSYKLDYQNKLYKIKFSFSEFVCTLDYLYLIGAIKVNERGQLCYETA